MARTAAKNKEKKPTFLALDMVNRMKNNNCKTNTSATLKRTSFARHRMHCAVLLALGPMLALPASAQSYTNFDGSKTNDLNAAVATWASNAEFKSDWGLGAMNAQYAYALGFSGKGVKLGTVDSGLLLTHQEFAGRGAIALDVTGTYLNDGSQNDSHSLTWKGGDAFNVPGTFNPSVNDNHGSHVSGTIAAGKNGVGMMGVSFNSQYYITNSNGTDGSVYGADMDYNYFKAAYGNLAAAGARVINSSWGSPDSKDDFGSVAGLTSAYQRLESKGPNKSWLDAVADVTQETGVLQVFAAGNAGTAQTNIRSALPYFRPELESHWLTAAALNPDLTMANFSNRCGVAKYWCLSAPGADINSLEITSNTTYASASGTSMAAPHVTGALGILMERYSTLGNEEIRTILLTTAKHLGDGPADTPNAEFGWGIPDLEKGMNGPGQLLGVFKASMPNGSSDTWSNNISEAALIQRKMEETAEVAAWAGTKAGLSNQVEIAPAEVKPSADLVSGMAHGRELLLAAITANSPGVYDDEKFQAALAAVRADPSGSLLEMQYASFKPRWDNYYSLPKDYTNFIADRDDEALAYVGSNLARQAILTKNDNLQVAIGYGDTRNTFLSSKVAGDYVGSLVKTGTGTLTLTGNNSYSGGTRLQGGTLGVGSSSALGTGTLAMSHATVLQAVADKLTLTNAITLSGLGMVDTQAFAMDLSGNISDGTAPGGLAKQGAGTLTLTGNNTYSGPTLVNQGLLAVNGSLVSDVTVSGTGVLGGSGRIGSLTANSGATVAPGNSIGTLNVAGNVRFAKGSNYEVQVDYASRQSDSIAAAGKATVEGGTVKVRAGGGDFSQSSQYNILSAKGGVAGTFSDVNSNFAFLTPSLSYSAQNVFLTLDRNDVSFEAISQSPNQYAIAPGVEMLQVTNPIYHAVAQMDAPSARAAFNSLSGEIHASERGALVIDSQMVRDGVNARLRAASGTAGASTATVMANDEGNMHAVAANAKGPAFWVQALGSKGHTEGDGNAADVERSADVFTMGADTDIADGWRVGVTGGHSSGKVDVSDRASSGTSDSYHLGLYGGKAWGPLALRTGMAYAWHDIDTNRQVAFQGFSDNLQSAYSANTSQAFGELGYSLKAGPVALEPFANLAYVDVQTQAFQERGGAAALTAKEGNTAMTFSTLGAHASTQLSGSLMNATLRGTLGWRHAFGSTTPTSSLAFANAGSAVDIAGAPIDRDAAVVVVGLDIALSPVSTLGFAYSGQIGPNATDQSLQANLSLRF